MRAAAINWPFTWNRLATCFLELSTFAPHRSTDATISPSALAVWSWLHGFSSASIDPIGGSTVPLPRRYFLGGSSGVRGWSRYEISPLSESGVLIGGNSLFALSTELRARIRRNLGAVAFLDSGNVWADTWGINLRDLRYAIGSGLRYQTPVGPIRFDFGYQLNPIPGLLVDGEPQSRRWRMHFSIGQAF